MTTWFDDYPDILASELAALEAAGFEASINEEARGKGIIKLDIIAVRKDRRIGLTAIYPEFYPYFKPYVFSDDVKLDRHQNPISNEICLLGRSASNWHSDSTLADILGSQLPILFAYEETGQLDKLLAVEEPQGEPFSVYFNGTATDRSYILIDSSWDLPASALSGVFRLRFRQFDGQTAQTNVIQGWVEDVRDSSGAVLARWTGPTPDGYRETAVGNWVRRQQLPRGDISRIEDLFSKAAFEDFTSQKKWPRHRHVALSAIIAPEEIQQQKYADGWLFQQWVVPRIKKGMPRRFNGSIIRTARAGTSDLAARMPAISGLQDKTVAIFGLGALGAPIAMELARSGVQKLKMVDYDYVEPSTVRRWELGWSAFGEYKATALAQLISREYPWTKPEEHSIQIGSVAVEGEPARQREQLIALLDGVDLIVDATTELGVTHLLSDRARIADIPLVVANCTPGAWGGMVANFAGPEQACWMCLRHALYGEDPDPEIHLPPSDEGLGAIQPPGCASVTFTGASFDIREVGLETVRTVAGLMADQDGYPPSNWDLAIVRMRNDDGERIPPNWTVHRIAKRPECKCRKA